MTNAELVDSRKFNAAMDKLCATWPDAKDDVRIKLLDGVSGYFEAELATKYINIVTEPATKLKGVETSKGTEYRNLAQLADADDGKTALESKPKRGGWPKGKPRAKKAVTDSEAESKAALLADMNRTLTAAERKEFAALAMAEQAKVRDQQSVVNDAVEQVIVPNWNKVTQAEGYKHFIVNANRNGEQVSFEIDRWKAALALHKIPCSDITFKPEGLGMSNDGATTKSAGQAWRVIIG